MLQKFLFIFLFSCVVLLTAQTTNNAELIIRPDYQKDDGTNANQKKAMISFNRTSYNLGQIIRDSTLTNDFVFENIGNSPLLISYMRTSCHCAVTTYPHHPLLPGETDKIVVT